MAIENPTKQHNDDVDSSEDESQSSSSSDSSSSSSDDDSSTGTPPPNESSTMNGEQIRQNAMELLKSSPGGVDDLDLGTKKKQKKKKQKKKSNDNPTISNNNTTPVKANGYRSYQDAPTAGSAGGGGSQHSNSNTPYYASPNPPWANSSDYNYNNSSTDEGGLSMTNVASMAFSCVAHCLTEGYRAASNYYSGYPTTTTTGPASHTNYDHVESSSYNHSNGGAVGYNNHGSSSSYQAKFSDNPAAGNQHGEVMERGDDNVKHSATGRQSSGQGSTEQTRMMIDQKEDDWATVKVPSTYQGGRVGG